MKSFENVSVLCTERNERALNLITVQWRNMLHVSQVIFLLSSQILLIWQYTLVPPESPPGLCPSMRGHWWSSPRRCCCSAPSGDACHVSRVTCHVSRVRTTVTMLSTLQHHNICDLVIPLSQRWAPLGAEKISSYLSLSCLLDNLVFCKTTR